MSWNPDRTFYPGPGWGGAWALPCLPSRMIPRVELSTAGPLWGRRLGKAAILPTERSEGGVAALFQQAAPNGPYSTTIIWLQCFFSSGGHFAFINNFDGFLVYYYKFNRQKFDIFPYCPKVIKFLLYDLIFGSVGCENSKYTCMMHVYGKVQCPEPKHASLFLVVQTCKLKDVDTFIEQFNNLFYTTVSV